MSSTITPHESVAIIAMRGRFPGARDVDTFWQNLRNGVESIVTYSDDQLRAAGVDETWSAMANFVRRGTILDDIEMFDAPFFGYSARDAQVIDPQQRLFLECCWEALEEAGYDVSSFPGLIGVYAGSEQSSYMYQLWGHGTTHLDSPMASIGNDKDYLTTQVSYKLNLRGPSLAVQTACSTSLVAVCVACQNLLGYQCDMALAGGTSVLVPQTKGYFYQPGGIWSPDGHCRTFDAAGQGTVVGSGIGVVVLKRLSDALANGDHIHAVIRGSALNNDGALKVGFGAPSIEGQAQVIAMAQTMAGADPASIGYVEAHGTATVLGDPIEMAALTQVFSAATTRKGFCAIGSVKSNVGHLASAAGVTGLIKAALVLEREEIPPTLHFQTPNPQVDFASGPFFVNTALRPWPRDSAPRFCAISSFGVGGTNAHVVLEEAPLPVATTPSRPAQLIVLSAKTPTALEQATDNLAAHLDTHPSLDLADAAFTLQVGRKAFGHRRVMVWPTGSIADAAATLRARDPRRVFDGFSETRERPIVFLFSGQGSQYVDMARGLYGSEVVFRQYVDGCCDLLAATLGYDLRDVMFPPETQRELASARLTRTSVTQPALFTIEYALAQLWLSWGITPSAMLGHSIGEYVAACLSGVLSLPDALGLVAYRGQLMEQMPDGAMLAVPLAESELSRMIGDACSIAAVNGPQLCVASGPIDAIDTLTSALAAKGVQGRRLVTSHAFHSPMMDPIVWPFMQYVQTLTLNAPQIAYLSNVTGTWITAESTTDPSYWGRHLRQTVRFHDDLKELAGVPDLIGVEMGPGQQLCTLMRQIPGRSADQLILPSIRSPHESVADSELLLQTLGRLWLAGTAVSWKGFAAAEVRRRVSLPTYPFERERYWVDPVNAPQTAAPQADVSGWFWTPAWRPIAVTTDSTRGLPAGTRWLLFDDGSDLGRMMASALERAGIDVIAVLPGETFESTDDRVYTIRPDELRDYVALVKSVCTGGVPDTIVHLWSASSRVPSSDFDAQQRHGLYSLTWLAQALEKQRVTRNLQLCVVTRAVQAVLGDETLCPARATVLGPCRVIPQEYPNIRCRIIDLGGDLSGHPAGEEPVDERVVQRILDELRADAFEPSVALRHGRRWVQSYERARFEARDAVGAGKLREGGVYFITGGLSKVGLALASALTKGEWAGGDEQRQRAWTSADRVVTATPPRLVLTSRMPFPSRDRWDAWLAEHPSHDRTARVIARLMELEEAGAEVSVVQADLSSRDDLRRVLDAAERRFGAINGVIHAAGYTADDGFGAINLTDRAMVERQLAAKARSLMVLDSVLADRALGNRPLDFCVLVSSLSAVLGGLGLMAYASANLFLDAYAASRNQDERTPWISINWDRWQFPEEIASGAAAAADVILPAAGAEAFLRILTHQPRQVVVSVTDLDVRLRKWVRLETLHEKKAATPAASNSLGTHARPSLSTPFVAPSTPVEETIAEIWQDLLGVHPIGVHDKFFELGGHSLLAIQLIARLREAFDVELSAQRLFEAPTVARLAEMVQADTKIEREPDAAADERRIEELLAMVETLSDAEVADLLANPEAARKGQVTRG